jgi:hypothetical protein
MHLAKPRPEPQSIQIDSLCDISAKTARMKLFFKTLRVDACATTPRQDDSTPLKAAERPKRTAARVDAKESPNSPWPRQVLQRRIVG